MASSKVSTSKLKEEFLSCPLCMEDFHDPRTLDCLHTVCYDCLSTYARTQGADQPGKPLKCPMCRTVTTIPQGGVPSFRKNHFVKSLLDMTNATPVSKPCELCTSGDPGIVMCLDCNRGLCDFCRQAHTRQVFFKGHRMATYDELKQGQYENERKTVAELCEEHLMQKDLFCDHADCQLSICMKCKIVSHEGHPTLTITKRSEQDRLSLEKLKQSLLSLETREQLEGLKGKLCSKDISESFEKGKKIISECIESVVSIVRDKGQSIGDDYCQIGNETLKNVSEEMNIIEEKLKERRHIREFVEELLQHSSQADLVNMAPAALKQGMKLVNRQVTSHDWDRWKAPVFNPGNPGANMEHLKNSIGSLYSEESNTDEPGAIPTSPVSVSMGNDQMVDTQKEGNYLTSAAVERVFRAVDRADYFLDAHRDRAYNENSYKSGNIHLSSPCIYSTAMNNLNLGKGMSFLNIGSGSGYLNTLAGLMLGSRGSNLGIDLFDDVVKYAYGRLENFQKKFQHFDKFDFCVPNFVVGNGLQMGYCQNYFDRIYCGADCPLEYEEYMKKLLKIQGVLVMPFKSQLVQVTRVANRRWTTKVLLQVSFAPLQLPS